MEKLKKSFKSITEPQSLQKRTEEKQVLLHQDDDKMATHPVDPGDRTDVLVKINGKDVTKETELAPHSHSHSQLQSKDGSAANNIWRDSSYDFSNDPTKGVPPNFDFGTDSPLSQRSPLSRIAESPNYGQLTPREVRVSFNESMAEPVRRRSNVSGGGVAVEDEVVVCSTNSSFRRKSSLLKTKTKSRLMDPPEHDQRSQRQLKSGMLGKGSELDEDDPFLEEDLPEEYKKMKFSKWTVLQLMHRVLIPYFIALGVALSIHCLKGTSLDWTGFEVY